MKSNTIAADIGHTKGTVLARIVKANIPVKNGVVHLIDRPLMIVATNVISYLQVLLHNLNEDIKSFSPYDYIL